MRVGVQITGNKQAYCNADGIVTGYGGRMFTDVPPTKKQWKHIPIQIWEEIDNTTLADELWTKKNTVTVTNHNGKLYLVSTK